MNKEKTEWNRESFWRTIVQSQQWTDWYAEQMKRFRDRYTNKTDLTADVWDIDESQECNLISPEHWQSFIKFLLEKQKAEIKMLITKEINIANSENEKTSRLTSLFVKLDK